MTDANELNALDNEIKHENKLAIIDRYRANNSILNNNDSDEIENCIKSAIMHEQSAKWLTELKEIKLKENNSTGNIEIDIIDEFESELTNKDNIDAHEINEVFNSYYNFDLACHIFRQYVGAIALKVKKSKENKSTKKIKENTHNDTGNLSKLEEIKYIIDNTNQWSKDDPVVKAQGFMNIEKVIKRK